MPQLSYLKTAIAFILWPLTKPLRIAQEILHQPQKAFIVVDFLKGISVLMVILFHVLFAVFFLFKQEPAKLEAFVESIPPWLTFVLTFDKAVDIFFMLSSFLLSYALFKVYAKQNTIQIKRFYLHRFFRIYPLFLVALLLYGLADLDKLLHDGWYSLLFIENIFSKGIIPVQWSLSIEVQFYLILPFIILFLVKSSRPIIWLSALVVVSILMRFGLAWQTPEIFETRWYEFMGQPTGKVYMDTMYYVIESRLTPLLLGVLWAFIIWRYPQPIWRTGRLQSIIIWGVGLTIIYISLRFPIYQASSSFYSEFSPAWNLFAISLHRPVFSLALLGLILFAFYQVNPYKLTAPLIHWKGWRLLSEVAYPMYFFHFPFIVLAWAITLRTINPDSVMEIPLYLVPIAFALAVLMTLYLSLWLNFLVEARFIRIGKRIEAKWFNGSYPPAITPIQKNKATL